MINIAEDEKYEFLECFGKCYTLKEWSDRSGIPWHQLYNRLNKLKWPVEKALLWPINIEIPSKGAGTELRSVKKEMYTLKYEWDRKLQKERIRKELMKEKGVKVVNLKEQEYIFKRYSSHSGMWVKNPNYKKRKKEVKYGWVEC